MTIIFLSTDKIEIIFRNLIDIKAFDKITINQTFHQKFLDRQLLRKLLCYAIG